MGGPPPGPQVARRGLGRAGPVGTPNLSSGHLPRAPVSREMETFQERRAEGGAHPCSGRSGAGARGTEPEPRQRSSAPGPAAAPRPAEAPPPSSPGTRLSPGPGVHVQPVLSPQTGGLPAGGREASRGRLIASGPPGRETHAVPPRLPPRPSAGRPPAAEAPAGNDTCRLPGPLGILGGAVGGRAASGRPRGARAPCPPEAAGLPHPPPEHGDPRGPGPPTRVPLTHFLFLPIANVLL